MSNSDKVISSNYEEAQGIEQTLRSKCIGVGEAVISKASKPNITAVGDSVDNWDMAKQVVRKYKTLLDADAAHINKLGYCFYDIDRKTVNK